MINDYNPIHERQKIDVLCFCFFLIIFFITCTAGGLWGTSGSGSFSFAGIIFTGGRFVLIYFTIWLASLFLVFYFPKNNNTKSLLLIMAIGVIARALLFFQAPSDDVFRYLWEGSLFTEGINPYLFPPNDSSLATYAAHFPFHSLINHPDITTAYPPLVIYIFSLITRISVSVYLVKAVMLIFDLGAVLFLVSILAKRKINIRWAMLYAFNPLVLYSFAGEGHFDSMQNFFLLGALWCYDRKKWLPLFILAGLAIQVKYVAVIALPFFINRDNIKVSPVVLFPLFLPYIPFITKDPGAVFAGIHQFAGEFAFNGSVNSIFRVISGEINTAALMCRILFIGLMLFGVIKFNNLTNERKRLGNIDPAQGILYALSCIIILSPTIHIWYISWILPFAVIRNTSSWFILSLTACFYYIAKSVAWFGGEWVLPAWAQILEWSPFFVFFGFELCCALKRDNHNGVYEIPDSVSVIIPVINEEAKIQRCIRGVKKDPSVTEIIVVDGGSTDNTADAASLAGAFVIINNKSIENGGGRGGQIIDGINSASGDIVAIIHADTIINSHIFTEMKDVLSLNPDVAGGAAGTVFETPTLKMKFIEFLNGLRVVFFGISFGDQIQFFRRKEVVDNELFPDIPLMEDVEFSLKLHKAGRRVFLFGNASVSARRWQTAGSSNFFLILRLFFGYMLQRPFKMPDVARMYQNYYNN